MNSEKQQQWITDRVQYIRGLKSPSEQQQLLIFLNDKTDRTARDHALYQSAGLLIMAGLVDSRTGKPVDDAAALLGALAGLNDLSRDNPKWSDWKVRGQALLKNKKADDQV